VRIRGIRECGVRTIEPREQGENRRELLIRAEME
jgi:hypothetical protein